MKLWKWQVRSWISPFHSYINTKPTSKLHFQLYPMHLTYSLHHNSPRETPVSLFKWEDGCGLATSSTFMVGTWTGLPYWSLVMMVTEAGRVWTRLFTFKWSKHCFGSTKESGWSHLQIIFWRFFIVQMYEKSPQSIFLYLKTTAY